MTEPKPAYQSYLLRLWRTSNHGKHVWRASLESAQTGERRSFADLVSLFTFLEEQTDGEGRQRSPRSAKP